MKQCISWIIRPIILLWRTLKKYACKKKLVRVEDVDNDGKSEIIIDLNNKIHNDKEE